MKNNIGTFFQACLLILAGCALAIVLLTSSGCGRREAEFLEGSGQTEEEEEKKDSRPSVQEEETHGSSRETAVLPAEIYVDVIGAVAEPGVYQLNAGSRVFQAIEAAGGFLQDAAGEYVNQAEKLEDGQQVYIPTREEAENSQSFQSPMEKSLARKEAGRDAQGGASGKINLNTADEDALTALAGIGASKAQAIVAYREEHGGFSAIEEILNVPGIKEGTFVKIKDNIAVE